MKKIFFTVTNDLVYDQRMHRICGTLARNGYDITLVGRKLKRDLTGKPFRQVRLRCLFNRGFLFYAEFNFRLFLFLLFRKADAICAIDLDTILPCLLVTTIRRSKRIYDAHELFPEMKEVVSRPAIHRFWTAIEKFAVPRFPHCYTVGQAVADEFRKRYGVAFHVIRNMPVTRELKPVARSTDMIYYGGAVNESRGFEFLIPAMKKIQARLVIQGDGNFMGKLKKLVADHEVRHKVEIHGMVDAEELFMTAQRATIGISLTEKEGLNQYLSLANKFFDYLHAGLPQLTMDFPEYRKLNDRYGVAVLIDDCTSDSLAGIINSMLGDKLLLDRLHRNALEARKTLCWEQEEKHLVELYKSWV